MTPTDPNHDPIRAKIIAAMDRLLAGTPLRSTGRLSVSQLAVEAGVGRWHLTHQHLDLKEQFQARVASAANTPAAFTSRLSEFENLKLCTPSSLLTAPSWRNGCRSMPPSSTCYR